MKRNNKSKEGNLISWKLVIDKDNRLITELSFVEDKNIDKIFEFPEREKIKKLVYTVKKKVKPLHEDLQQKLS